MRENSDLILFKQWKQLVIFKVSLHFSSSFSFHLILDDYKTEELKLGREHNTIQYNNTIQYDNTIQFAILIINF